MARPPVDAALSLARRRKRNREAMQRLRERQQLAVEQLRATAAQLATTYEELMQRIEPSTHTDQPDATDHTEDESLAIVETKHKPLAATARLEQAKQHAQALIQENARLQTAIDECVRREDRFALLLDDLRPVNFQRASSLLEMDFATPPHLSLAVADELMRLHRERRVAMENQWLAMSRSPYSSQFLGWDIRYFFQGEYLYVKFNKLFRHVTQSQVSQRVWNHALKMQTYRLAPNSLRMVQRVHENAFVYAGASSSDPKREVFHMRFRVEETDGVIGIGTQTLPPPAHHPPQDETRWGSELSLFVKLTPERSEPLAQEIHCAAELSGRVKFGDAERAHRNALEMVISLARWEEANVRGSPMQLIWQ